jgi:hypothetical protein
MIRDEDFEKLKKRVEKLEEVVSPKRQVIPDSKGFKGLNGGFRFLIKNNFFNTPKSVEEIKRELDRESYFYPYTSVSKVAIDFVKLKRILTRIKEDDVWKYVIRK